MNVWPSLIYLSLTCLGMGANKDWTFGYTAAQVSIWALLWWGGFFDPLIGKF